jgi:hypothetical protein
MLPDADVAVPGQEIPDLLLEHILREPGLRAAPARLI